jgi:multiple sugar transport system ATP-binding protein
MLEANLSSSNGTMVADLGSQSIELDDETLSAHPALASYAGKSLLLGIRPEDLEDAALSDAPAERRLKGTVSLREALGSEIMVHFSADVRPAVTEDVRELAEDLDATVAQGLDEGVSEAVLVGRFGARSRVRQGDAIEVAVDTRALHFFDADTGLGIYNETGKGAVG